MSGCNQSPAEDHDFQIVKRAWQERSLIDGTVLNHSEERLICKRCGKVVNPFEEGK